MLAGGMVGRARWMSSQSVATALVAAASCLRSVALSTCCCVGVIYNRYDCILGLLLNVAKLGRMYTVELAGSYRATKPQPITTVPYFPRNPSPVASIPTASVTPPRPFQMHTMYIVPFKPSQHAYDSFKLLSPQQVLHPAA